jgi:hypothetical protein
MTSADASAQVLVRVGPALFGHALSLALRSAGVVVAECPEVERRRAPRPPRHFAVAILSDGLPCDATAGEIVHVRRGEGSSMTGEGELCLDRLVREVTEHLGRAHQGRAEERCA